MWRGSATPGHSTVWSGKRGTSISDRSLRVGPRSAEPRDGVGKAAGGQPAAGGLAQERGPAPTGDASGAGQCAQARGLPVSSAVRNDDPHPQAATAFGLFTVKPAPISVST